MAIKASTLMKSAEGDLAALQMNQAPDVRIGGDLVVGHYLAVPAGQTWEIDGDVKIEGNAMLKIEDGATLQANGHQQRLLTLQALAEIEPGELERLGAEIKQYALEPEPTDADRQMVDRIRRAAFGEGDPAPAALAEWLRAPTDPAVLSGSAVSARHEFAAQLRTEADRFALVSPAEAERLRAQINNPFLLSPDEAQRVAAQFTSGMTTPAALAAGMADQVAAIQGYTAELMRPPKAPRWVAELAEYAQPPRWVLQFEESQTLLAETIRKALEPTSLHMINEALGMLSGQGKYIAESLTSWAQPIEMAQNALRNSGYSLGLLDDTNRAIDRLHEQRQAPPARRPEQQKPYERLDLDYALQKGVWRPVEVLEKLLQYGDVCAYIAEILERKSGPRQDDGNYPEEKVKEMWLAWLIADTKKRKELLEEWHIAPDGKYHYKLFRQHNLPLGRKQDTN